MISLKIGGIIVTAFIAGAFLASPELRAYAANTVFSTDIKDGEVKTPDLANNAVTSAKIKDGEVKAADIAADAVGASELTGVSKLLFGQCILTTEEGGANIKVGSGLPVECKINGVDSDDSAIATLNNSSPCVKVGSADPQTNLVDVDIRNDCSMDYFVGRGSSIAVIVYDR
jgi:hypothetical protein